MKKAEASKDPRCSWEDKISGLVTFHTEIRTFVGYRRSGRDCFRYPELAWERVENVGDILKKRAAVE